MGNNNYYVYKDIKTNPNIEGVFKECVEKVMDGTVKIVKPDVYELFVTNDKSKILPTSVLEYYLYLYFDSGFKYDEARDFTEKMRLLMGWNSIYYTLKRWVFSVIRDTYFYDENGGKDRWNENYILRNDIEKIYLTNDHYRFACYIAIGFMKYGQSFDYINANKIFDYVTALGSDLPKKLKKNGSGELPKDVTEYKDSDISFKANDAFATIKISVKNNTEEAYSKILDCLCKLLKHEFPKSYSLDVKGGEKRYLPIKGIPKKGINQLFANAVEFPGLYHKIEEYANLAMNRFEWYNNLNDEDSAMPGTFAVFALGLKDRKYDSLIQKYLKLCDDEHSEIQGKFLNAYFEKYNLDETTIPILLSGAASMQHFDINRLFKKNLANEESLNALLLCKSNISNYIDDDLLKELSKKEAEQTKTIIWEDAVRSLFGWEPEKTIKALPKELRDIAQKVLII